MMVVEGTMAEELNDRETKVELRIHSFERLSENFLVTVFTLDCQTKQQIIFRGTFFSLFTYDPPRENKNKLSNFIFVICCFSSNVYALSRQKS